MKDIVTSTAKDRLIARTLKKKKKPQRYEKRDLSQLKKKKKSGRNSSTGKENVQIINKYMKWYTTLLVIEKPN